MEKRCWFIGGVILSCFLASQAMAASTSFETEGYDVEVKWEAKKKTGILKTWGNVKGGASCEHLHGTIHLSNSSKAQNRSINIDLGKYSSEGGPVKFSGETSGIKGKTKSWRAHSVELNCS